jgi:hypothetical protein
MTSGDTNRPHRNSNPHDRLGPTQGAHAHDKINPRRGMDRHFQNRSFKLRAPHTTFHGRATQRQVRHHRMCPCDTDQWSNKQKINSPSFSIQTKPKLIYQLDRDPDRPCTARFSQIRSETVGGEFKQTKPMVGTHNWNPEHDTRGSDGHDPDPGGHHMRWTPSIPKSTDTQTRQGQGDQEHAVRR